MSKTDCSYIERSPAKARVQSAGPVFSASIQLCRRTANGWPRPRRAKIYVTDLEKRRREKNHNQRGRHDHQRTTAGPNSWPRQRKNGPDCKATGGPPIRTRSRINKPTRAGPATFFTLSTRCIPARPNVWPYPRTGTKTPLCDGKRARCRR